MRSTILYKYLIVSQIILNKNNIHTFQKFKSFQDSSQVHSSRTILLAAFQRHFILKGSMEVCQTSYIENKSFKKQIIYLLLLMCWHFILNGSTEVRQSYYITNKFFKKQIIYLLFLMCHIIFWGARRSCV